MNNSASDIGAELLGEKSNKYTRYAVVHMMEKYFRNQLLKLTDEPMDIGVHNPELYPSLVYNPETQFAIDNLNGSNDICSTRYPSRLPKKLKELMTKRVCNVHYSIKDPRRVVLEVLPEFVVRFLEVYEVPSKLDWTVDLRFMDGSQGIRAISLDKILHLLKYKDRYEFVTNEWGAGTISCVRIKGLDRRAAVLTYLMENGGVQGSLLGAMGNHPLGIITAALGDRTSLYGLTSNTPDKLAASIKRAESELALKQEQLAKLREAQRVAAHLAKGHADFESAYVASMYEWLEVNFPTLLGDEGELRTLAQFMATSTLT